MATASTGIVGTETAIDYLVYTRQRSEDDRRDDLHHNPRCTVDTLAIIQDVMRSCSHLPRRVQEEIYADRVFQEMYYPDTTQ